MFLIFTLWIGEIQRQVLLQQSCEQIETCLNPAAGSYSYRAFETQGGSGGGGCLCHQLVVAAKGDTGPKGLDGTDSPTQFGNGDDGYVVLDGYTNYTGFATHALNSTTYTLTRSLYAYNLTILEGIRVVSTGWRILVRDRVLFYNNTWIDANGHSASGLVAGAVVTAGEIGVGQNGPAGQIAGGDKPGISVTLSNSLGGQGGDSGIGTKAGSITPGTATTTLPLMGGIRVMYSSPTATTGYTIAGDAIQGGGAGAAGAKDKNCASGAGGSGGNVLMISTRYIDLTANSNTVRFTAHGGKGGDATLCNAGGGGGGGGGWIAINTMSESIRSRYPNLQLDVSGGSGGAGFGGGSAGSTGSSGNVFVFDR